MAFNPFRAFRKHQKVLFAGLTILCMVTFVMCGSMGKGDFFEAIAQMFTGRRRGDVVATLFGKDVTAKEIQDLRNQRRLADAYIRNVTELDRNELFRAVMDASRKWEQPQQQLIQQTLMMRSFSMQSPQFRPQYIQALRQLESLHFQFAANKKTAEADQLRELLRSLEREVVQMLRPRNELYFGGTTSLEDLLDFMIWRHEAERRGIQLNRQEISELVRREIDNRPIPQQKKIEQALAQHFRTFNAETFRTALADEFRVRIVKSALMGSDPTLADYPGTWATPHEFWEFYKENRTENTIAALPIPARNKDFLAQVGQPTEKELKDLFEKYKDREYQAGSPEPGFKVPPRIEVEWVSANPDSEHYRKEAARAAALRQAGFQILAGGGQTLSGSIAAEATAAAIPLSFDFSLINEYDFERYRLRNASWIDEWNPRLHDPSIRRVENAVAALGQMLGGAATGAPVASGAWVFQGSAHSQEMRNRARFGSSVLSTTMALAPTGSAPLVSSALIDYGSPRPEYIPLAEVRDRLAERLQQNLVGKLVQTDLGELQNKLRDESRETAETFSMSQTVNRPELIAATLGQALGSAGTGAPIALTMPTTLGPPAISNYVQTRAREALVSALAGPNPTPFLASGLAPLEKVRKTIFEAVKRYGLEHGSTRQPEDRDSIANDPGLATFKEAYLHDTQNRDPQVKNFANQLFQNPVAYSPQNWPLGRGEFDHGPSFLYWRTNDKPAYVPTFAEVQGKVKDWWQLEKARDLAKKEAEELKTKAQGQPDAERWLKDGTKHSEPMFLLDEVAGYVKNRTPFATGASYQRYTIPREKIEYPPDGLENELVKMNEVGQVIVRADRPQTTYYVLALVKRTAPSTFAFYREYGSGPESLLGAMEQETGYQSEYRKGLITQLREEAHLKINEENRKQVDEGRRDEE
jgi:hypothetical protein